VPMMIDCNRYQLAPVGPPQQAPSRCPHSARNWPL
jgi:hypothetical protein